MDSAKIQKLSYVPVRPIKKEDYPWMKRQSHNSDAPMDFITTQYLSYMPPGELIDDGPACVCSYPGECMLDKFPKADVF